MELDANVYLGWKNKVTTLDLGIPEKIIDEYFFKFNEGNIDYIKNIILTYILVSPNIINLINVSRNESYIDLIFDSYDLSLDNIIEYTTVTYQDKIISDIECQKFKSIILFDKFNKLLKMSTSEKRYKLTTDFYFIKDRYLNKLTMNELFDLYARGKLVKKLFPEITNVCDAIETRLNSMITIKNLMMSNDIIILDQDKIKEFSNLDDLSLYIESFRNSQIDLLIDVILCK